MAVRAIVYLDTYCRDALIFSTCSHPRARSGSLYSFCLNSLFPTVPNSLESIRLLAMRAVGVSSFHKALMCYMAVNVGGCEFRVCGRVERLNPVLAAGSHRVGVQREELTPRRF